MFISFDHALCFSFISDSSSCYVLNHHPRSTLISSIAPSAGSFSIEIRSFCGIDLFLASLLPTIFMARSIAAQACARISSLSSTTVDVLPMYTSNFYSN